MNLNHIKTLAVERGIRPARLKKTELVRAIQAAENNQACYMTNQVDRCGQEACLWRTSCN